MNSNWSYGLETAKLGVDLCDLDFWPLTLTFCMGVTSVIGNKSWKFHDGQKGVTDRQTGRTDRQTDGQTDRQTDWTIHRAAWSQLKKLRYHYHCVPCPLGMRGRSHPLDFCHTGILTYKVFQCSYSTSLRLLFISDIFSLNRNLFYSHRWTNSASGFKSSGPGKMATISQTIFSNVFSWMKSYVFWLKFHWSLFLRV